MKTIRKSRSLQKEILGLKRRGLRIGFVPTMGCLHEGHLSLVRSAAKDNDLVVVSIFVNPIQFGPREDYQRYPRTLAADKALLACEKKVLLFVPRENSFYDRDFQTSVSVSHLSQGLCGRSRPTHFTGVATVVLKLLQIVQPDALYLGQKDYQQYRVIAQMTKDMSLPVRVRMLPTVREPDGLAMSSRNALLGEAERKEALFLYRALKEVRALIRQNERDVKKIKKNAQKILRGITHGRPDYFEIVDAVTLQPVVNLRVETQVLAAGAVYFRKTRLIDNLLVRV